MKLPVDVSTNLPAGAVAFSTLPRRIRGSRLHAADITARQAHTYRDRGLHGLHVGFFYQNLLHLTPGKTAGSGRSARQSPAKLQKDTNAAAVTHVFT